MEPSQYLITLLPHNIRMVEHSSLLKQYQNEITCNLRQNNSVQVNARLVKFHRNLTLKISVLVLLSLVEPSGSSW